MSHNIDIETPTGVGRWVVDSTESPRALLLLGHGAGGAITSKALVTCATQLPAHGITVARFIQPWKLAGGKVTARPPVLDQGWLPAVLALVSELGADLPVYLGGHSAGARVACRTANQLRDEFSLLVRGVVAMSFPLHPPGAPEKSRVEELLTPTMPVVVIQGERDPFGTTEELREAIAEAPHHSLVEVPGAAHDLAIPARNPAAGTFDDLVRSTVLGLIGE